MCIFFLIFNHFQESSRHHAFYITKRERLKVEFFFFWLQNGGKMSFILL